MPGQLPRKGRTKGRTKPKRGTAQVAETEGASIVPAEPSIPSTTVSVQTGAERVILPALVREGTETSQRDRSVPEGDRTPPASPTRRPAAVIQPAAMADSDSRRTKAPQFDGADWWTWKFRFEQWAVAEGLHGYFDGTVAARPGAAGDAQEKWDNRQRRAFAELVGALVPDNLIMLVREFGTRRQRQPPAAVGGPPTYTVVPCRPDAAWERLESYFESQQLSSRLIIERDLTHLRMDTGESVAAYWARADTLRQKLVSAGGSIDSQTWMGRAIAGLPESWAMMQVVLNAQFATLTEAGLLTSLTAEQERQSEQASGAALWVPGAGRGARQDDRQQERGIQVGTGARQCGRLRETGSQAGRGQRIPPEEWGKRGKAPPGHCHGCHKRGHNWYDCRSRPGDAVPDFLQQVRARDGQRGVAAVVQQVSPAAFGELAMAAGYGVASVAATEHREGWWVDSGASHNFTHCVADFRGPLQTPEVQQVKVGDGRFMPVLGMGEVTVRGHEGRLLTLTKVHLVPSLRTRLLSVSHLTAKHFDVHFSGTMCHISKPGKGVFLVGAKEGGRDHGLVHVELAVLHPVPGAAGAAQAAETAVPIPQVPQRSSSAGVALLVMGIEETRAPQHIRALGMWCPGHLRERWQLVVSPDWFPGGLRSTCL